MNSNATQTSAMPLRANFTVSATTSYLSFSQGDSLVSELHLHNISTEPLLGVQLMLHMDPAFTQPCTIHIERLEPGEQRKLTSLAVNLRPECLAMLDEATKSVLTLDVTIHNPAFSAQALAHAETMVLPYEQWPGISAKAHGIECAHWLAAFCQPNAPAVEKVRREAAKVLAEQVVPPLDEQKDSATAVRRQAKAVYEAILNLDLLYSIPSASFASTGQKIRLPDRLIESGLGTCLDLAILFASCAEQSGLAPVLFLSKKHAWVGCWLVRPPSQDSVLTDLQDLRKRTDSGEMVVLEATLLTKNANFEAAARTGRSQLDDSSFELAIDVAAARAHGVLPLPSRLAMQPELVDAPLDKPCESGEPSVVPASSWSPDFDQSTPNGILHDRLSMWRAQMVDMSRSNRLLNVKPGNKTILVAPHVPLAELDLAFALNATALANPMRLVPDRVRGPRAAGSAGQKGCAELPLMVASLGRSSLNAQMQILSDSTSECEHEVGFNTLFLGLGMLEWVEDSCKSAILPASIQRAPVWLVPVQLKRGAHKGGSEWCLQRRREDALFNPALKELMHQRLGITLSHIESNTKLSHVLQVLRRSVSGRIGWEVHEQAVLGLFSFAKAALWQDLAVRAKHLRDNAVVAHLMDHPGKTMPNVDFPSMAQLSQVAQGLVTALPTDASQRAVLAAVDMGHDVVVQGPPGNGKSQTVAALITHAISQNKTVLFVSEKLAALDVVHRRLQSIGLAPSCLELHSNKANTHEVMSQLASALEAAQNVGNLTASDAAIDEMLANASSAVKQHAGRLNAVMHALHTISAGGFSLHQALAATVNARMSGTLPTIAMPWSDPDTHDPVSVQALRDLMREVSALAPELPNQGRTMHLHPLRALGPRAASGLADSDTLREGAKRADIALHELERNANIWLNKLGIDHPDVGTLGTGQIDALCDLVALVESAPARPRALWPHAMDRQAVAVMRTMLQHNQRHNQLRQSLPGVFADSALAISGHALEQQWQAAENAWGPWRWWLRRKLLRQFHSHSRGSLLPSLADVRVLVQALPTLQYDQGAAESNRMQLPWVCAVAAHPNLHDGPLLEQSDDPGVSEASLVWLEQLHHAADAFSRRMKGTGLPDGWASSLTDWIVCAGGSGEELTRNELDVGLTAWTQARSELALLAVEAGTLREAVAQCAAWQASASLWPAWHRWHQLRGQSIANGLGGLISAIDAGHVSVQDAQQAFEQAYQVWWANCTLNAGTSPMGVVPAQALAGFSGAHHERHTAALMGAVVAGQATVSEAACQRALSSAQAAIHPQMPDAELGTLHRELVRQRGHRSLRQLLQTMPTLLTRLKPCWLMSPVSVAQYLGHEHPPFDIVIFDEASQIPVCEAVGAMSRGRQVVLFGDPKQLPPTRFFERTVAHTDESDDCLSTTDLDSVLDECMAIAMPKLDLSVHYRSENESLIAFSNQHFYQGRLITCPSSQTQDTAVQWVPTQGQYDRGRTRTNQMEAQAVANAVQEHCTASGTNVPSLGVVCFSQPQQQLIESLVRQRRKNCPALDRALSAMEASGERFFVRSLESVQGDERDSIFFSITYGPDAKGRVSMNFGPLNQIGGERRLNVAITRARRQVRVFTSMHANDIAEAQGSQGVQALRAYLDWVERGSAPPTLQRSAPDQLLGGFEALVKQALQTRGWQVHGGVGRSGQRVDLAVVDPHNPANYLLALLCDGAACAAMSDAQDREVLRIERLQTMGWTVRRLWLLDWVSDHASQIEMLDTQLHALARASQDAQALITVAELTLAACASSSVCQ